MTDNLFASGPDPVVGELLRRHFEPADPEAFAARVLGRLGQRRGRTQWEILAGWSRPGIAAGLMLAAALGYWMVLHQDPATPVVTAEVLDTGQPADADGLMAVVLGSGR